MQAKIVLSLTATIFLCLPSLLGGLVLLANLLLQRHLEDWGRASAASVALGVFIGGPLGRNGGGDGLTRGVQWQLLAQSQVWAPDHR